MRNVKRILPIRSTGGSESAPCNRWPVCFRPQRWQGVIFYRINFKGFFVRRAKADGDQLQTSQINQHQSYLQQQRNMFEYYLLFVVSVLCLRLCLCLNNTLLLNAREFAAKIQVENPRFPANEHTRTSFAKIHRESESSKRSEGFAEFSARMNISSLKQTELNISAYLQSDGTNSTCARFNREV